VHPPAVRYPAGASSVAATEDVSGASANARFFARSVQIEGTTKRLKAAHWMIQVRRPTTLRRRGIQRARAARPDPPSTSSC
jgi:hypothetical protein